MWKDLVDRLDHLVRVKVVNLAKRVKYVNKVISRLPRNGVSVIRPVTSVTSKLPGKGLVQQRLLQRLQRGELPFVETGEALGFFAESHQLLHSLALLRQWWCGEQEVLCVWHAHVLHGRT